MAYKLVVSLTNTDNDEVVIETNEWPVDVVQCTMLECEGREYFMRLCGKAVSMFFDRELRHEHRYLAASEEKHVG